MELGRLRALLRVYRVPDLVRGPTWADECRIRWSEAHQDSQEKSTLGPCSENVTELSDSGKLHCGARGWILAG